jgi:hypothetical protein
MKHVMAQLSSDIPELDEAVRDYVFLRMLEAARTQGFINIYRKNSVETTEQANSDFLRNGAEAELLQKSA